MSLSGAEKSWSTPWLMCMQIRFPAYSCLRCRFLNIKCQYRIVTSSKEWVLRNIFFKKSLLYHWTHQKKIWKFTLCAHSYQFSFWSSVFEMPFFSSFICNWLIKVFVLFFCFLLSYRFWRILSCSSRRSSGKSTKMDFREKVTQDIAGIHFTLHFH